MEHKTDIEARIDSEYSGRCRDGLWGNLLCLLSTIRFNRDYPPPLADDHAPACIAGDFLSAIQLPIQLAGQALHGGASVGVGFFPDDARNSGNLFRTADRAVYAAKREGGGRYNFIGDSPPGYASSGATAVGTDLAKWASRIDETAPRKSLCLEKIGNP